MRFAFSLVASFGAASLVGWVAYDLGLEHWFPIAGGIWAFSMGTFGYVTEKYE